MMNSPAVILGCAFKDTLCDTFNLFPEKIKTKWGLQTVYSSKLETDRTVHVIFRHGVPHKLLPHQINYRAMIESLKIIGCNSLLVTSSVGILNNELPLFTPLLLTDLLMLDNRLPDGSACTMFPDPVPEQGHLVINEGLFSKELSCQIAKYSNNIIKDRNIIFSYNGGPRTKTSAENQFLKKMGLDVNSMTLAPEVILANELLITCSGLVVGHKYSGSSSKDTFNEDSLSLTLDNSRESMENIIVKYLKLVTPIENKNMLYQFE